MEKVINNLTNIANGVFERMIMSIPAPDSPYYWTMIAALITLLSLLVIWLFVRLHRAGRSDRDTVRGEAEVTLSDVAAQAAADARAGAAASDANMAGEQAREEASQPVDGFKFFKKPNKANAGDGGATDPEDDIFLLGLEQEMLATRQLYLDGLISKEVYVTETRALYDKAQTRMT
jgi:hypothetical protein